MQLTKNFTLEELTFSSTAKKLKINNIPDSNVINNLKELCIKVLQPIRDKFGPINVTSGYRCQALNKAVNGSTTSNHLYGYASDIQCKNHNLKEIYDFVVNNLNFDECLFEKNRQGTQWLHLAYRLKGVNRKKCSPNYRV